MTGAADELYEVVSTIYEKNREKSFISPAWMATEGMVKINFPQRLHPLGYIGCHLQFRQIARSFCRTKFDPTETVYQYELFSGTLQERYPGRHASGEETQYVLLGVLSESDGMFNVNRMRRASLALQKHSDALEAHIQARRDAAA